MMALRRRDVRSATLPIMAPLVAVTVITGDLTTAMVIAVSVVTGLIAMAPAIAVSVIAGLLTIAPVIAIPVITGVFTAISMGFAYDLPEVKTGIVRNFSPTFTSFESRDHLLEAVARGFGQ